MHDLIVAGQDSVQRPTPRNTRLARIEKERIQTLRFTARLQVSTILNPRAGYLSSDFSIARELGKSCGKNAGF